MRLRGFCNCWITDEHFAQTPILLPAIHIALTGSVYAVVAVAVERYIIICNPYNWTNQGQIIRFTYIVLSQSSRLNVQMGPRLRELAPRGKREPGCGIHATL